MKIKALSLRTGGMPQYIGAVFAYSITSITLFLWLGLQPAFAGNLSKAPLNISSDTIFNNIIKLPADRRVTAAADWCKTTLHNTDPHQANAALNKLNQLALRLNDLPLQCAAIELKADYYADHNGFNSLSTTYYQQAIAFARQHHLEKETAICLHRTGLYYFTHHFNNTAAKFYLQAQEEFIKYGLDRFPGVGLYYVQQANLYLNISDWENAENLLKIALNHNIPTKRHRLGAINSLGIICRNTGRYQQAIRYFQEAIQTARQQKDSIWVVIAQGNIGAVYFMQHNYQKALPLIESDYKGSMQHKEKKNALIALLRLIEINIDDKHSEAAARQLDTVIAYIPQVRGDTLRLVVQYYNLKSQLYEQTGNLMQALLYRKKYEATDSLLNARFNLAAVERVELKHDFDRELAEVNRLKHEAEITAFKRNAIIIILVLMIAIIALIYRQQTHEARENEEQLKAEKEKINIELSSASEALLYNTTQLKENNSLIEKFKEENFRLQSLQLNTEGARQLAQMLQNHLMTEDNWADFRRMFSEVYPAFFQNLKVRFPQLTNTDIRLVALIKLNLSSREIASLLGITSEGIKKARQRLRKKIDVPSEELLSTIITSL